MSRFESLSDYIDRVMARLRTQDRASQTAVLVQEIAELRLQVQNLSQTVSALAAYCELSDLFDPAEGRLMPAALPRSACIDASQDLHLLDGFYELEYTQAGKAYRWTGPQRRFRFNVWVDRSHPVDAALHVVFGGHPSNATGMRLFVDGRSHPLRFDAAAQVFIATGLPVQPVRDVSRFEFEVAAPHAEQSSEDPRVLGVPFTVFEVTAQDTASGHG